MVYHPGKHKMVLIHTGWLTYHFQCVKCDSVRIIPRSKFWG